MRPELARFFESMERYLADPSTLEALLSRHPEWKVDPERVGLYGRFVQDHLQGILEKLYPLCRATVSDQVWQALVDAYYRSGPARHFELNRAGERFPSFAAEPKEDLGLPPYFSALACFEWTDFAVYASNERIVAQVGALTPNPTLRVLEHEFRLCEYVRHPPPRVAPPRPGPERALLWRHPHQDTTHFMPADERSLLILKMAVEQLPAATVARETGLPLEQLSAWTAQCVQAGLVLAP